MDTSKILQYSPPRTGSTLLYNILRVGYPEKEIVKQHGLTDKQLSKDFTDPIIVSVRNPLDIVSSSVQRYGRRFEDHIITSQIEEIKNNGIFHVLNIFDYRNVLILKYEDFVYNWDYMFNEIEMFLEEEIPEDRKNICRIDFSIDNVKKQADRLGQFKSKDGKTQIHGMHVSKFKGRPDHYKETLSPAQIKRIYNVFEKIFEKFDYFVDI